MNLSAADSMPSLNKERHRSLFWQTEELRRCVASLRKDLLPSSPMANLICSMKTHLMSSYRMLSIWSPSMSISLLRERIS